MLTALVIAGFVTVAVTIGVLSRHPEQTANHEDVSPAFRSLPPTCLPGIDDALRQEFGPIANNRYDQTNESLVQTTNIDGRVYADCVIFFRDRADMGSDPGFFPAGQPISRQLGVQYAMYQGDDPVGRAHEEFGMKTCWFPDSEPLPNVGEQAVQMDEKDSLPPKTGQPAIRSGLACYRISNLVVEAMVTGYNSNGQRMTADPSSTNKEAMVPGQATREAVAIAKALADSLQRPQPANL